MKGGEASRARGAVNWEAVPALGQLIGALAVVATLG